MKRILGALPLLTFLALAPACGSDPGCEIEDNHDGTRTIDCPGADPVRVVDAGTGGTCSIGAGEDGGKVIQCTDGTVVRIDKDGNAIFPGTGALHGIARLFGKQDHTGITVRLEGTEYETTTGKDGTFELGPVPAGIYVVVFEANGRAPERRKNVPVINGVFDMDPVELRLGRWVAGMGGTAQLSPVGGAALVWNQFAPATGWLDLWKVGDEVPVSLGTQVDGFGWSDDGSKVLFHERFTVDGPVRLHDVATGETRTLVEHSDRAELAPAGGAVVYETNGDEGCRHHVWRDGAAPRELGACSPGNSFRFGPDGETVVRTDESGALVLDELEGGRSWSLGTGINLWAIQFSADGRRVVFPKSQPGAFFASLFAVDRVAGEVRQLGRATSTVSLSPDGGAVLFADNLDTGSGDVLVHEFDSQSTTVLLSATAMGNFAWAPDGRRLLLVENFGGFTGRLHLFDLDRPEVDTSYAEGPVQIASFVNATGEVMLLSQANELVLWDPVDDGTENLGVSSGVWTWSPDGRWALFLRQDQTLVAYDVIAHTERTLPPSAGLSELDWLADSTSVLVVNRDGTNGGVRRWKPGRNEVKSLVTGFVTSLAPTDDGGGMLYLQCDPFNCGSGMTLRHYDFAKAEDEGLDTPVQFYINGHGTLLYFIADPAQGGRGGWYLGPEPEGAE